MILDLSKYTSVRIGPIVDIEIIDRLNVDNFLKNNGIIIGRGCNILVSNNPPPIGILSDSFDFIKILENCNVNSNIFEKEDKILCIGAKTKSSKIYGFSKKNNISGFEFLRNIPGFLGGLLKMNAGAMNNFIFDNLIALETNYGIFSKRDLKFGYRFAEINGVILQAWFKINFGFNEKLSEAIFQKRANQPKGASFGSCFKNPDGDFAARLIQECGLKGFKINKAGFSDIHSNFIINYGNATFDDVLNLMQMAKDNVFKRFGIELENEVVVIGN